LKDDPLLEVYTGEASTDGRLPLLRLGYGIKDPKRRIIDIKCFINLQHGSDVAASITIIWCRPYSDQISFWKHELVPFLDQLMSTTYQSQVVDSIEFRGNFVTEKISSATRTHCPSTRVKVLRI
jgi:hypothetical protein